MGQEAPLEQAGSCTKPCCEEVQPPVRCYRQSWSSSDSSTTASTASPFATPILARPPPSLQRSNASSFDLDSPTFSTYSRFSSSVGCWDDTSSSPSISTPSISTLYPASTHRSSTGTFSSTSDVFFSSSQSHNDLTPWISTDPDSDSWSDMYDESVVTRSLLKRKYRRSAILATNTFYLPPLFPENPSLTRPQLGMRQSKSAPPKPSPPCTPTKSTAFGFCTSFCSIEPLLDRPKPQKVQPLYITLPRPLNRAASSQPRRTHSIPPPNPWRAQLLTQAVSQSLVSPTSPPSKPRRPAPPPPSSSFPGRNVTGYSRSVTAFSRPRLVTPLILTTGPPEDVDSPPISPRLRHLWKYPEQASKLLTEHLDDRSPQKQRGADHARE